MATVTTSEFVKTREPVASFSMLEQKGIVTRLVEEASLAFGDFTRDPRGFLREIFSDESKDAQRSKRLRMGLAFGLVFQLVVIGAIAIAGWRHATASSNTDEPEYKVDWVPPKTPKQATDTPKESSTIKSDASGNNPAVPKGDPNAGSKRGGGGQENPAPTQLGVKPLSLPNPAIISPDAPPSQRPPAIVANYNIEGLPSPPPPPDAKIGVANGDPNSNSGGPGKNGGIGPGDGPGVGGNSGPGGGINPNGSGPGGGDKGDRLGRPDGITPTGPIDFAMLKTLPGSTGIVWISRVRPIVTPEAQADRVVGYVLLEATFNANGTITDIRVRQSLGTMDAAAIESLRKARFRPATDKEGKPITLLRVPIKVNVNMS